MRRLITAGFLAGCISLSQAQNETVVITATRFPDAKRDLPVGVTIITADDIRKSASSNLPDILAQFGLLQVRNLAGTQNQQVDLRGFGITGDQNTLILVDGLRITENELESAQLAAIPLESIERIEIVRGGGAVLYGSGATGGTINIITRRGTPGETRAHALARAGGYGTEEARAGVERYGENLGGGLFASYEDTNGYRRNSRYRDRNAIARVEAYSPVGRVYAKLGVDELRQRLPGSLTEAEIAQDPRQTDTPNDWREREGVQLAIGGTKPLGRHELSADLGYRSKHSRFSIGTAFGDFTGDGNVDQWTFSPRGRFAFDALGRTHELVTGVDLEHWQFGATTDFAGLPSSQRTSEQSNAALYAQANLWLASATRLVLGTREQRMAQRLTLEFPPSADRTSSHHLGAYEAALRQGFGAGWWAYGRLGKSFRVANFDENACFFPATCPSELLRPQTALGSELGAEYDNGRVRGRASVYQIELNNEIYFSPLVPPFGANINLSPTRRRGVEFEGGLRARDTLDLRAALAFLEARFRSGTYGGVDVTGKTVPLVPAVLATAGASWRFSPASRFNVNARYVGRERFDNDQANNFHLQPTYGLVDVKLEHRPARRVELALEVRNLFDKRYFSYGAVNDPVMPTTFSALPEPGRAAYASVAWRLD